MTEYHCLISGLPELFFVSDDGSYSIESFLSEAGPVLDPIHLDWVNRLILIQGHKPLLRYLNGETVADIPTLPYSFSWTDPHHEAFTQLPVYLQEFVLKFKKGKEYGLPHHWDKLLSEGYYHYLSGTGNGFINSWVTFDMNVRNYITSKIFRQDLHQRKIMVMPGNKFAHLLLEFSPEHKEVQVDWPLAATIDKILENPNLLEREKAFDQLTWEIIDSLNLFNYFTIEVILGYTIKLLITERWKNILLPDRHVEVGGIIEDKVKSHFIKNPLSK